MQNLSTFCFAINLVGLALTLACASTLFTSQSRVWGLSKLPHLGYGVMELAPLRSPVTKRDQNSAGSKPGLVVYAEHSITSDFICLL